MPSFRKLVEARKLADSLASTPVELLAFPPTGKPVTLANWHNIDELYVSDCGQATTIALLALCHQFVHSHVFVLDFTDDGRPNGAYFASDRQRTRALLFITVQQVIDLFREVGQNNPRQHVQTWNDKRQDCDVQTN